MKILFKLIKFILIIKSHFRKGILITSALDCIFLFLFLNSETLLQGPLCRAHLVLA